MTRIIAGALRGRRLEAPRGTGTRPTSDKVRQALFDVLGQFFEGGAVLDLYAGSGALALEALSRGCDRAVCVESDRDAAEIIRRNAAALGLGDRVHVLGGRVEDVLPGLPRGAFALVFVDPPYAEGPDAALPMLAGCLAPGGRAAAEHDARRPPPDAPRGLRLVDRRRFGSTGVSIYACD